MKNFRSALGTFVMIGLLGCSSSPNNQAEEAQGKLSVALVGVASNGTSYRLRSADFQISGYPEIFDTGASTTPASAGSGPIGVAGAPGASGAFNGGFSYFSEVVSSETNPDDPVITKRLVPGSYYVSLLGSSWFIERLTPSGPERVASSVLLSAATQFAYIWNGGTSTIAYRFGVDGQPIDFRSGELNIQIQIELPGEGQSQGGFPSGGASGGGFPSGGASFGGFTVGGAANFAGGGGA